MITRRIGCPGVGACGDGFSVGAFSFLASWAAGATVSAEASISAAGASGCGGAAGAWASTTGLASSTIGSGFGGSGFCGGAGRPAATLAGVMKRGFAASAGVAGFGGGTADGFVTNVFGGAAGFGGSAAAGFGGAAGAGGGSFCCVTALSTSPGFEIFERSIFGRNSECPDSLLFEDDPAPACFGTPKCFLTFSASSASRELEWVFFSVMPRSVSTSKTALLFTSSSRARSLIRIFIRRSFPPCPALPLFVHIDLTVHRFTRNFLGPLSRLRDNVEPFPIWTPSPIIPCRRGLPHHGCGLPLHPRPARSPRRPPHLLRNLVRSRQVR